jgi:hypothetical protein
MSGVEQFTAAVPERSGPMDWCGGLEAERRKARTGQGRALAVMGLPTRTIPRPRFAREKKPVLGGSLFANDGGRDKSKRRKLAH